MICDDESTDNTLEIISSFEDPRIKILKNKSNQGLPKSRNKLLRVAQGRYLAWLDADDIAYPNRLEEQFNFLERHSEIYVLSNYAHLYDEKKETIDEYKPPISTSEEARAYLFFQKLYSQFFSDDAKLYSI